MSTQVGSRTQSCEKAGKKRKVAAQSEVIHWTVLETYLQTFKLALYLMPIQAVAFQVTLEAIDLSRVKHYEKESHRRRWLTNQRYKKNGPTKLLAHDRQLIQHIIYGELQKYERYHEGERSEAILQEIKAALNKYSTPYYSLLNLLENADLSLEDLILRYLAAAIYYANNSSKDLVTAIACLICNYSPQDAAQLHTVFKQVAPNYCSKRKGILTTKLAQRFQAFITLCRREGRQSYFTGQDQPSPQWSRLVENLLSLSVPWGTSCPEGPAPAFSERLHDWLEQLVQEIRIRFIHNTDWQEISYLHALTCPNCFLTLMQEMKLGCPRARLALPLFSLPTIGDQRTMKKQPRNHVLKAEEEQQLVKTINDYLAHQQARRQAIEIEQLSFIADNELLNCQYAEQSKPHWQLARASAAQCRVNEGVNLIKIIATDSEGELVLATFSLPTAALAGEKIDLHIRLAAHTKLKIAAQYQLSDDDCGQWLLECNYINENLAAVPAKLRAFWPRLLPLNSTSSSLVTILIAALLIGALGIKYYFTTRLQTDPVANKPLPELPVDRGIEVRTPTKPAPDNAINNSSGELGANIFELSADNTAVATSTRIIKIAAKAKELKLRLLIKQPVVIKGAYLEANIVNHSPHWQNRLSTLLAHQDNRGLIVLLPTRIFANGEYQLTIKQSSSAGEDLTMATYTFQIAKAD